MDFLNAKKIRKKTVCIFVNGDYYFLSGMQIILLVNLMMVLDVQGIMSVRDKFKKKS